MHRDTQEELDRLEAALLAEEECPETAPVGSFQAYNADRTDTDPEELSRELMYPKKDNRGLAVLAGLLSLGILAVVLYWLIRLRGAF